MDEIRFKARNGISEALIERQFALLGLQQTMKGNLKTLPPNIHWHLKRPKEAGVCEVTLLVQTEEVIISCKKNRSAAWIPQTVSKLRNMLSA